LLSQTDGVPHAIPVAVLPPNPKVSNFPLRCNIGEAQQKFRLQGSGLERIDSISSAAGDIAGKAEADSWSGKIHLKSDAEVGRTFPVVLKIRGLDEPVTIADAIEVVGPRPKIEAVKKSLPGDPGIEITADELPAGTEVGLVLSMRHLRQPNDDRPKVSLGCRAGEARKSLTLSPDDAVKGVSLSFARSRAGGISRLRADRHGERESPGPVRSRRRGTRGPYPAGGEIHSHQRGSRRGYLCRNLEGPRSGFDRKGRLGCPQWTAGGGHSGARSR
jgi:hypothetical protein